MGPVDEELPDPVVVNFIDLDDDGESDFLFAVPTWGINSRKGGRYSRAELWAVHRGSEILGDLRGNAFPLERGAPIAISDSTMAWDAGATLADGHASENVWRGPFIGEIPKYVGVRLQRDEIYYYGWIWLNIDTMGAGLYPLDADTSAWGVEPPKLRVYGRAIKAESHVPIRAGEEL